MGMMSSSVTQAHQSSSDNPDTASTQAQQFIPVHKKEFVQFSDATVWRKHFDITYGARAGGASGSEIDNAQSQAPTNKANKNTFNNFALKDLVSAGGTFVCIPPWQPTVLKAGMLIVVSVSAILAMMQKDKKVGGHPDLSL
jgi:hypothetical protein